MSHLEKIIETSCTKMCVPENDAHSEECIKGIPKVEQVTLSTGKVLQSYVNLGTQIQALGEMYQRILDTNPRELTDLLNRISQVAGAVDTIAQRLASFNK